MAVNTKDKYYTPDWLVEHTIKKAIEIIGIDNITDVIEPSAGDGAFIEGLKRHFEGKDIYLYDLHPEHPEIARQDYLQLRKSYKKGRLVIGNPPFGTSSSLWKAFCKKSAKIADYIAFVSPASQYKSNYYFKEGVLVYSELLNDVEYRGSEVEGGKAQKVRTCLNIYKVYDREEEEDYRIDSVVSVSMSWRDNKNVDADYFLQRWANGSGKRLGEFDPERKSAEHLCIKVLDEKYRHNIEEFCKSFNEKFNDEIVNNREGHVCLTPVLFKDKLRQHIFPTREERLEQDVLIKRDDFTHKNDYDFIIDRSGWNLGRLLENPEGRTVYFIKILNEEKREKIVGVIKNLENDFKHKAEIDLRSMSMPELKEALIKHLYPTREERLEQDVYISLIDYREPNYKEIRNTFDWYLPYAFSFDASTVNNKDGWGIKILNENKRKEIEEFLVNFNSNWREYIAKTSNSFPILRLKFLKDILVKHLYPTREERLEQDVEIKEVAKNNYINVDFYFGKWGGGLIGKISDTPKWAAQFGIKILNENKREEIEQFFTTYRGTLFIRGQSADSGSENLHIFKLKEQLIKHLYPQDEYDEYPEVKKPVIVERQVFAKELF